MQNPTSPENSNSSTGSAVAKATAGIGVLHLLRLVISFATAPLIARIFGSSRLADVWAVASDIVSSLWLVFEKTVNPTVLPLFAKALKDDDEKSAWRFASLAFCVTTLGVILVTPLAWVGMPFIVDLYSQKAPESQREFTVAIARVLLGGLFFLSVSSLTYVILNGYKRFATAALGDAFWRLGIMIAAAYAFAQKLPMEQALSVLAYGFLLGAFLKLAPQLWALRAKWALFKPNLDLSDPRLKTAFFLAIPMIVGVVTSEGRDIYRNYLADSPLILGANGEVTEGSRALLKFSRAIISSLIQLFPYALSIGIFPYLADLARGTDKQPFTQTLVGALRACLFIFAPITAIFIALRLPLLRLVWEGGNFSYNDTLTLIPPFIAYCVGMMGLACENVLNQSFYAQMRPWAPTIIGIIASIIFVVTATLGVHWGWGLAAIAGAESLQKTVKCLIMWRVLRPQLGEINRRENALFFAKTALCSVFAAIVAAILVKIVGPSDLADASRVRMALAILISGSGAMLAFGVLASLLKVEEMKHVGAFLKREQRR